MYIRAAIVMRGAAAAGNNDSLEHPAMLGQARRDEFGRNNPNKKNKNDENECEGILESRRGRKPFR